jgi:hypothetical protein
MARVSFDMTDEEIEEANLDGERAFRHSIRALSVDFFLEEDVFYFTFINHEPVTVPRAWLQGLEKSTPTEASTIELLGRGAAIRWPAIDTDHRASSIAQGRYGSDNWMRKLDKRRATEALGRELMHVPSHS